MNMNFAKKCLVAVVATMSVAVSTPAFSGTTQWQEVMPDVRVRLVSSDSIDPRNVLHLGLEIQMPHDTKTYWRVPGDSGIPAQFDWQQSANVERAIIHWPLPERDIEASGTLSYVYHGDVIIPLDVYLADTSVPVEIKLDILLGICSDICVPVAMNFNHLVALDKKDVAQSARIAVAHAQVPLVWPKERAAPIDQLGITDNGSHVAFRLTSDMIDPNQLIIEPLRDGWFIGRPIYDAARDTWLAALHGYGQSTPLAQTEIRYVFDTREGPFEYTAP